MKQTYKYRLYPTAAQRTKLNDTLELCRWADNETLAMRRNAWQEQRKSLSLCKTNALLPEWKRRKPELNQVYSQVLQNVQVRVDLGLSHFAMLSTGKHIPNPRFFRKDEKALAKAQRRLSRCKKGTAEYRKYQRVVQHIHQRITNRRRDVAHKLSRRLVREFQIIVFGDLDITAMQKNGYRSLHKSISDAAWNQLVRLTRFKAERPVASVYWLNHAGQPRSVRIAGRSLPKTCVYVCMSVLVVGVGWIETLMRL